jgi:transposase
MSTMPKKIDEELKARSVRPVNDHLGEYPSVTAASAVVAKQLGVGRESVRRWVVQSQVEINALKARVRRLEEDNAILKSATVFFAGELDPATADHGFPRHRESRGSRGRVDLPGSCVSRAARSPRGPTAAGSKPAGRLLPGPAAMPMPSTPCGTSPGGPTPTAGAS